jgi:hypothetical protein
MVVLTMASRPTALIQVAVLCRMLLEALEQLDGELASEAIVADLRDVCEQAHLELERQAGLAGA